MKPYVVLGMEGSNERAPVIPMYLAVEAIRSFYVYDGVLHVVVPDNTLRVQDPPTPEDLLARIRAAEEKANAEWLDADLRHTLASNSKNNPGTCFCECEDHRDKGS